MKYAVYDLGDKIIITDAKTSFIMGIMFPGLPSESVRNFEYSYGSAFFPKDVVNWNDIPRLADVPFFSIDYTDLSFLLKSTDDLNHRHIKNIWWIENKINGRIFNASNPLPPRLEINWIYTPENPLSNYKVFASALEVDENHCYMGNRDGLLSVLNHQGELIYSVKLSSKISHIIKQSDNIYLTCDDGKIYHWQNQNLEVIYNVRPENNHDYLYRLLGLSQSEDNLALIDIYGNLTLLNPEFKPLWSISTNLSHAINLNSDGERIFVGHSQGIDCYSCNGQLLWRQALEWGVMWQYLTPDSLFFGCSDSTIYRLTPRFRWSTNYIKIEKLIENKEVSYQGIVLSTSHSILIAHNNACISYFTENGNLISRQFCFHGAVLQCKINDDQLYGITTQGTMFCVEMPSEIN